MDVSNEAFRIDSKGNLTISGDFKFMGGNTTVESTLKENLVNYLGCIKENVVNEKLKAYLPLAGGTITGNLIGENDIKGNTFTIGEFSLNINSQGRLVIKNSTTGKGMTYWTNGQLDMPQNILFLAGYGVWASSSDNTKSYRILAGMASGDTQVNGATGTLLLGSINTTKVNIFSNTLVIDSSEISAAAPLTSTSTISCGSSPLATACARNITISSSAPSNPKVGDIWLEPVE